MDGPILAASILSKSVKTSLKTCSILAENWDISWTAIEN